MLIVIISLGGRYRWFFNYLLVIICNFYIFITNVAIMKKIPKIVKYTQKSLKLWYFSQIFLLNLDKGILLAYV